MGHKGGCGRTAAVGGSGKGLWGRGKKQEAENFSVSGSLDLLIDLPLIALIHLTKLTKKFGLQPHTSLLFPRRLGNPTISYLSLFCTSYLLANCGFDVRVFEANNRMGDLSGRPIAPFPALRFTVQLNYCQKNLRWLCFGSLR